MRLAGAADSHSLPRRPATEEKPLTSIKTLSLAGLCLAAIAATAPAHAQSTDGYHSIQIFPLVVDSASFAQRFTFRNPDAAALTLAVQYFPGTGTSQATAIACSDVVVPANGQIAIASLRTLCPALATGPQFGYLYTNDKNATRKHSYAAFSRVSNPAGIGFTVEAFPAHTFTSADGVVTGLRRFTGSPGYQSNCFVGKLNNVGAVASVTSNVFVTLRDSTGAQVGATTSFPVGPGKITRLLDVFSAVGAPAGNYDEVRATFEEDGTGEPGIIAYCTVQDNTSFGADFRIAKQERGFSQISLQQTPAAQDEHVLRDSLISKDTFMAGLTTARPFTLAAGAESSNTHVVYFRHPDYVQCELIDPATNVRALPAYGLEMRMVSPDGSLVAGGNLSTGWDSLYLGDKASRNNGANTRYTIEVETSGVNGAVARPYKLHCVSGSGHSDADIVRYQEAADRF
jgi:hypothetical protein